MAVSMDGSPNDASGLFGQDCVAQKRLDELVPVIYSELRRLASSYLKRERRDHTLQTTALVHEAYLRLLNQRNAHWENKNQFLGIAAQLMRRILVDYARSRHASKRGGTSNKVFLEEAMIASPRPPVDVVVLDEALTKLAQLDSVQARIVELRFFGGLNIDQVAEVTGISARTVKRSWRLAKARLARELEKGKQSA
ncbi:MAG TPA: ECF-type sigma factor [Candidatus Acidoferrum sp.]|nr:ECF-type sigma factor [Candidatus Acidoferrum sp.]